LRDFDVCIKLYEFCLTNYFDSKGLEENTKIIKEMKSSSGKSINGERLGPEGLESEPYELTVK